MIGRNRTPRAVDSRWTKPLVVLVNQARAAVRKLVAYALQKHKLAKLVGTQTAWAVVAGQGILLADRSLLYLAVADVRVDGVRLEGIGVRPDVVVEDRLEYCAGKDRQLEAALETLIAMLPSSRSP